MATDLHLDADLENFEYLKEFYKFAESKNPDLIFAYGDIADKGFARVDMEHLNALRQGPIEQLVGHELNKRSKHNDFELSPYEYFCTFPIIAQEIYFEKRYPKHVKELCKDYLFKLDMVEWNLNNVYEIFNHIIKDNRERTYTLPGNHDLDLEQTILKDIDLHNKAIKHKNFKIAGYGSAIDERGFPFAAGCVPELTARFNEYLRNNDGKPELFSEPRDFLLQEKPDMVLLHNPPLNYLDFSRAKQAPTGSRGLLQYAQEGLTEVFLSGHLHTNMGIQKIKTKNDAFSVIINPGPLGNTIDFNEQGLMEPITGGNFLELELDDETKRFLSAKVYKIQDGINNEKVVEQQTTIIRNDNDELQQLITNPLEINVGYNMLKNRESGIVLK